jgi:transposase, IS5 family
MKPSQSHFFFSETAIFAQVHVPQNRLIDIKEKIDFEQFNSILFQKLKIIPGLKYSATKWNPMMLFKCVWLGILFDYSDAELEYQMKNRIDFKEFLDLGLKDSVPDEKTIWKFREDLRNKNVDKDLFNSFNDQLKLHGFSFDGDHIVDGTIVEAEGRCTSPKTDDLIKDGNPPESRKNNHNSMNQTDLDASWKSKGGKSFFGYLALIMALKKYKFITSYHVNSAHVDERKNVLDLIKNVHTQFKILADKGFVGEALRQAMKERGFDFVAMQKEYLFSDDLFDTLASNYQISKERARVEHVFGNMRQIFGFGKLRSIGIVANSFTIGMRCMIHNMLRFVSIENGRA